MLKWIIRIMFLPFNMVAVVVFGELMRYAFTAKPRILLGVVVA